MKTIYEELPSKRRDCIATIGVFDGVHLGHQLILNEVKKISKKYKISSLVITFDIPPQKLLNKKFLGCINDYKDKKILIKSLGIDFLWILKTNQSLLKLSGEEFIKYILKYFRIKKIIVGEDFRFGYKGKDNIFTLNKLAKKYQFDLKIIKKKSIKNKIISSSFIRKIIKKGDFKKVKIFLGRDYILKGKVIKGKKIGKKIGFPTANLSIKDYIIPSEGVYVGYAWINNKKYLAAINIGKRPTVSTSKKVICEVYVINFDKNIYGKEIKLSFLKKLRKEKKFSSLEKLKEAIKKDISYIFKKYHYTLN
jgi:riboflavin kinase/FMN adenylyltransferase